MAEFPLIVRAADAARVEMSGGRGESIRLIDEGFELETLNARFNRLESNAPGRRHHHPRSDLLCYIVSGLLELETPRGVEILGSGDLAFIPARMDHAIRSVGEEPLKFLEVYVPGRPEFIYP